MTRRTYDQILAAIPRSKVIVLDGGRPVEHHFTDDDRHMAALEQLARDGDAERAAKSRGGKAKLRAVYRHWVNEEVEVIELIEAVATFLGER